MTSIEKIEKEIESEWREAGIYRSPRCYKTYDNNLNMPHFFLTDINMMDTSEEFAEKIGNIARVYVDFKEKYDESDNSLSDILTYSKYDRERLRFIVSRIGRGIQLSKTETAIKKDITEKISSLQPACEITDERASRDFSYFYFKGYYTKEGKQ